MIMKKHNGLYYDICNLDNIKYIYEEKVKKTTKNKKNVVSFDNYYMENIYSIKNDLSKEKYVLGRYNIFLITKPKVRVVMSQKMYDKVINHLVSYFILNPVILPCLIDTNVATRKQKGTDYGIKLFKEYLVKERKKYHNFYILKFDISKYFYNIDHDILKKLLRRRIKDEKAIRILFRIIDSTNEEYVNKSISLMIENYKKKITDLNVINQLNSIPLYKSWTQLFNKEKLIVRLRNDTKKNFKKKMKRYKYNDYEKYIHVLGSYKGHLKYASSKNLWYEVVNKGWLFFIIS